MAGECDGPKKEDPPPPKGTSKGYKGKSDKGRTKRKPDEAGKGKALVKQVGEASEVVNEERQLRKQESDPKEPDSEPQGNE